MPRTSSDAIANERGSPGQWRVWPLTGRELLAVTLVLELVILLRFSPVLTGWWYRDDPLGLDHAARNSAISSFVSPAVHRELSTAFLCPWLTASFRLDWALWGFHPEGFYLHQLVSLLVTTMLFYRLLRIWFPVCPALLGSLFFVVGPVGAVLASYLSARHYLEGLAFALGSLLCAFSGGPRPAVGGGRHVGAGILFALALLSKEIFLGLVVAALLIASGSLRERLRGSMVYVVGATLYLPYRMWMLGDPIGGYSPDAVLPATWRALVILPLETMILMVGPIGIVACAGLLVIAAARVPRDEVAAAALKAGGLLSVVLLPLLPVANSIHEIQDVPERFRLLLGPAILLAAGLSWAVTRALRGRGWYAWIAAGLSVAMLLPGFATGMAASSAIAILKERQAVEGRFLVSHLADPGLLQVRWLNDGVNIAGLRNLAMRSRSEPARLRVASGGRFGFDAATGLAGPFYRYSEDCGCIIRADEAILRDRAALMSRRDDARPLRMAVRMNAGLVSVNLGPHEGQYEVLLSFSGASDSYDTVVPSSRILRRRVPVPPGATDPGVPLRVLHESAAGWVAVSPEFRVRFQDGTALVWERP